MNETESARNERIHHAERAHDREHKFFEVHAKQIEAFSIAAMKAPALVAAGGVAAILGFYSANFSRLSTMPLALDQLNEALKFFFFGLFATLLSPGLAYFSQLAYADSTASKLHTWEHPYAENTTRSKIGAFVGDAFRWLCVGSVVASIALIAFGGWAFLKLVNTH